MPAASAACAEHAQDPDRSLVRAPLQVERRAELLAVAAGEHRDRAGVRHVRHHRAERDEAGDVLAQGDVDELARERLPGARRLDAGEQPQLRAARRARGLAGAWPRASGGSACRRRRWRSAAACTGSRSRARGRPRTRFVRRRSRADARPRRMPPRRRRSSRRMRRRAPCVPVRPRDLLRPHQRAPSRIGPRRGDGSRTPRRARAPAPRAIGALASMDQ